MRHDRPNLKSRYSDQLQRGSIFLIKKVYNIITIKFEFSNPKKVRTDAIQMFLSLLLLSVFSFPLFSQFIFKMDPRKKTNFGGKKWHPIFFALTMCKRITLCKKINFSKQIPRNDILALYFLK